VLLKLLVETCQDKVQCIVVLNKIREPVRTKCSGVWSSVPSGNLSGQSAVECGPQYHQRTCQNEVQLSVDLSTIREPVRTKCSGVWSQIPSENLSGQSAVECVPQYHQRTCQDKVQWSVVCNSVTGPSNVYIHCLARKSD